MSAYQWRLEPHCCQACYGRIASREADDGTSVYQCTNCGAEAAGTKPSVLCACGTKIRKGGKSSSVFVNAGLRCHANEAASPSLPSVYVVSYGGAQSGK